jgi:hypothetical protein
MGKNFYLITPTLAESVPELVVAADKVELLYGPEKANLVRFLGQRKLHIGKSSKGWAFALHVFTEVERQEDHSLPANLEDWVQGWFKTSTNRIVDEYGDTYSVGELLTIICDRPLDLYGVNSDRVPYGFSSWGEFFDKNCAEPGQDGFIHSRVGLGGCVGHGEGPWDLIATEFS